MPKRAVENWWSNLNPWIRDLLDLALTVGISLIVLKIMFGADMIVPLVVVTSGSMEHEPADTSWLDWMAREGLDRKQILDEFPMTSGFNTGDMLIVIYPGAELGDVIIYERDRLHDHFAQRDPIIHRVVGVINVYKGQVGKIEGTMDCVTIQDVKSRINDIKKCGINPNGCPYTRIPETEKYRLLVTKGDNNERSDQCSSIEISYLVNEAQVLGRAQYRLPYIGWLKILLNWMLTPFRMVFGFLG